MRLNKKEKELLQQAFAAPAPKKKRAFLRTMPRQDTGIGVLILSQAAYIRKWVWVTSMLVFGLALLVSKYLPVDFVWILSSMMPFVALSVVAELAKSSVHRMAELEMTSRFSLRTILLARMVMIGAVQLFGLILMVPFSGVNGTELLLHKGVYLLVPYLLAAVSGVSIVRKLHGREGFYVCASVSVFISVLNPLASYLVPVLYEDSSVFIWVLAAVLLVGTLIKEYRKTMNQMEEFVWN